jgi:hypothetical protein
MPPFQPHLIATLFNDTTNSYKYYWFLAILNRVKVSGEKRIPLAEVAAEMLDLVWFPLNFFKLSFGKQDQFALIAQRIAAYIDSSSKDSIMAQVQKKAPEKEAREITRQILQLTRYVPYRFIRPFLAHELKSNTDATVNREIQTLANRYASEDPNRLPYWFKDDCIVLNEPWLAYFRDNIGILQHFCYWDLANFVQKHNPNVPGISQKLFRPTDRGHRIHIPTWKRFYEQNQPLSCIYSGQPVPPDFTLDHFLPWSFVVHDLNWNLVPVSKSINSSKSDHLPKLDLYLPRLVKVQWDFLKFLEHTNAKAIKEHYVALFKDTFPNIAAMEHERFDRQLRESILPQYQIASHMSFLPDWTYQM